MRRKFLLYLLALAVVAVCFAADEIAHTCQLSLVNGVLELERKPGTINIDQTTAAANDTVQTIGTTAEQIVIATAVVSNGVSWFRNLTTNTDRVCDIGVTNGGVFISLIRLKAEEVWTGRLDPTNNVWARARGGNVDLRVVVLND